MSREEHRQLTVADLEEIKDLLESGMQEQAENKLLVLSKNFSQQKNDEVYEQVGNLTRDLHELNLKEIGQVLDLSESRICQLMSQSMARLRSMLKDWSGK